MKQGSYHMNNFLPLQFGNLKRERKNKSLTMQLFSTMYGRSKGSEIELEKKETNQNQKKAKSRSKEKK